MTAEKYQVRSVIAGTLYKSSIKYKGLPEFERSSRITDDIIQALTDYGYQIVDYQIVDL